MLTRFLFLAPILAAQSLHAQATCGNVQLQLTPDYGFAIGSSTGGNAYTFSLGGKALAQSTLTQLALVHYDSSTTSTSGFLPNASSGVTYPAGRWGQALAIGTGGKLSYPAPGHISLADGTIELWIAATKDGTDPVYSKYDHTLFRYTSGNGDQLVFSESFNGSFYAETIIGKTFTGTSGGAFSISKMKAGEWRHLAFTYSLAQHRLRMYLDGILAFENDAPFSMPAGDGASFTIDSDPYGDASAFLVDELRISSDEKTAAQIFSKGQQTQTQSKENQTRRGRFRNTCPPRSRGECEVIQCESKTRASTRDHERLNVSSTALKPKESHCSRHRGIQSRGARNEVELDAEG
jgi:hypothetical protein